MKTTDNKYTDDTTTGHVPLPNFRDLGKVCGFTDLANAYEQACNQRDAALAACKCIARLSEGWTNEQMNIAIRAAQRVIAASQGNAQ